MSQATTPIQPNGRRPQRHRLGRHGSGEGLPAPGMTQTLLIAPRFCGPPGSGNGGYVCGRIAAYLCGPAQVTLRRPAPLATPLAVERDGGGSVRIHHGGILIAEA